MPESPPKIMETLAYLHSAEAYETPTARKKKPKKSSAQKAQTVQPAQRVQATDNQYDVMPWMP